MESIKSTFEYQILDSIRVRLCLATSRLQAPFFEFCTDPVGYLRNCRLLLRKKNLDGADIPYFLYMGINVFRSVIEIYTDGALLARKVTKNRRNGFQRYEGNAVFAVIDLHDSKAMSRKELKETIAKAMSNASIKDSPLCARKPLYKYKVSTSVIGPYV